MKTVLSILKTVFLLIQIPLAISNGSKRRIYIQIKKRMHFLFFLKTNFKFAVIFVY